MRYVTSDALPATLEENVRYQNEVGRWVEVRFDLHGGYVTGLGPFGVWFCRQGIAGVAMVDNAAQGPARWKAERAARAWLARADSIDPIYCKCGYLALNEQELAEHQTGHLKVGDRVEILQRISGLVELEGEVVEVRDWSYVFPIVVRDRNGRDMYYAESSLKVLSEREDVSPQPGAGTTKEGRSP